MTAQRLLRGEASALCTGPVDAHSVILYLERNSGASWEPIDQDSSTTIPYPDKIGLLVVIDCRPGTWRLRYTVTATHEGKTAKLSDASDTLKISSPADCNNPH